MAAIGREQLKKIETFSAHRKAIVARYIDKLKAVNSLAFLDLDYANIVSHIFVVRILDGSRDELMIDLRANSIECGIHYMPNHLLDFYSVTYALPIADKLGGELLSLPLHAELSTEDQNKVIEKILSFYKSRS
jgi:dTDP-4-amino-4,6-dideoxygalactose transaminase